MYKKVFKIIAGTWAIIFGLFWLIMSILVFNAIYGPLLAYIVPLVVLIFSFAILALGIALCSNKDNKGAAIALLVIIPLLVIAPLFLTIMAETYNIDTFTWIEIVGTVIMCGAIIGYLIKYDDEIPIKETDTVSERNPTPWLADYVGDFEIPEDQNMKQ